MRSLMLGFKFLMLSLLIKVNDLIVGVSIENVFFEVNAGR